VAVPQGRVYVADRENNRIQVYSDQGEHLAIWPRFERPTKLYVESKEELLYVAELEDQIGIVDLDGSLVGRYGTERSHDASKFCGPHGILCDSEVRFTWPKCWKAGACRSSPA
jgi:NHL repeat